MGTVTLPSPSHHHQSNHESSPLCPSFIGNTNFPDTFHDFFTKLSEGGDDSDESIMNILEDKQLLPSKGTTNEIFRRKLPERHWSMNKRSFRRRNNEMQIKGSAKTEGRMSQQVSLPSHSTSANILVSPMATRRRSSSIAGTRGGPDLNR